MSSLNNHVGVVVIGRNEGDRLKQCLASILGQCENLVYVDSASSDGSADYVESLGIRVLRLDPKVPLSAARARNEGFELLNRLDSKLQYIQFIDGDCQCSKGWLYFAYMYLRENNSCAIVSGQLKERFPEESVYNMLCDMEWNVPIGETTWCGGIFMARKVAFKRIGGFNTDVISGEEPELCYRLRKDGWSIFRLDHPMATHDAAITRFQQWLRRCVRSGHSYAQGFILHFNDGDGYYVKESVRIWFWAFVFPMCILTLTISIGPVFLSLISIYLVQFLWIALGVNKRFNNYKLSLIYSLFTIMGRWPEFVGQLIFYKRILSRKKYRIIEYN